MRGLSLALVIVLVDPLTKTLIVGHFQLGDSRLVTAFSNLVRAHNPGAAFSLLATASGWQRWFLHRPGAGRVRADDLDAEEPPDAAPVPLLGGDDPGRCGGQPG
jgi:hypothetical protein